MKKHFIQTKISSLKSLYLKLWYRFRSLRKIYQIAIVIALFGAFAGYKFLTAHGYAPDIKVVEMHKVSKGNILKTSRLLGIIEAKRLFSATAGYEGTVAYVAPAGSLLKTGDVIARIQNDPIEEAYNTALKAAQIATEQYNRQVILFDSKASSRQGVEDKFTALSAARNALVNARMNYDKIIFVAPFDGIVGSAIVPIGSRALPGNTIVTFYDNSEFVVKFDIPLDYAKTLPNDSLVTINGSDYKIDFIQKALSTGTYTVPAHINFPCEHCISGELVDVDLHLINKNDVIVIPESCVFIRENKHFVYKIEDNAVSLAPVTLGIAEKENIEITDGIEEGDEIVLKGQYRLYPGSEVKVFDKTK